MYGKAARILLSEKQYEILQIIVKSTTASFRLIQRARIILLSFQRVRNDEIATQVGLSRKQVGLWRRRWKQSFDALVSIECREPHATLRRTIENVLSDAPRAGAHGRFSAEQMARIMAIACESPEQSGRPVDHWTHRELAAEARQRGIVPSISARQVGRYLAESDLQPHRSKYWLILGGLKEDSVQFQGDAVEWLLSYNRMMISSAITDCGLLAMEILKKLPHTPVAATGTNFIFQDPDMSVDHPIFSKARALFPEVCDSPALFKWSVVMHEDGARVEVTFISGEQGASFSVNRHRKTESTDSALDFALALKPTS